MEKLSLTLARFKMLTKTETAKLDIKNIWDECSAPLISCLWHTDSLTWGPYAAFP
jgi:hypothetical protein